MRLELFEDNGLQMKIIVLVVVLMSFCLIVMVMRKYATGINGLSHNRLPVKPDDEGQSDEKDPIENIYRAYIENKRKNYNKAKPKERAHLMVSEWIEYAEKTIVLEFYLHHFGAGSGGRRDAGRQARQPCRLQQLRHSGLPGGPGRQYPPSNWK